MNLKGQIVLIYIICAIIINIVALYYMALPYIERLIKFIRYKLRNKLCACGFHKWIPVYCKSNVNGKELHFIACYCQKCRKGYDNIIKLSENCIITNATYNEKYFKN